MSSMYLRPEERSLISEESPEFLKMMISEIIEEFGGELRNKIFYRELHPEMRDGAALTTHIFTPEEEGSWPVVLLRNPYNLEPASSFFQGFARIFAAAGFAGVLQECRGTGSSEGEWVPFENERTDGLDTIDWLKKQLWNSGKIGTFGASYLSIDQWLMADGFPEEVKTMYLSVGGTERYRQMYMNGMFRHDIYSVWAVENSGITLHENISEVYWKFINSHPHITADLETFGTELNWYRNWISQSERNNPLWNEGLWARLQKVPSMVNIPVTMVAGWFDHHLDGMVCAYERLSEEVKKKSRLIIGPWDHSFNEPSGLKIETERILGTSCLIDAVAWFRYHLKGESYDQPVGVIKTYSIGNFQWVDLASWPPPVKMKSLFLSADQGNDLSLSENAEADESFVTYLYDPEKPVPTIGGSALLGWLNRDIESVSHGSVIQPEAGYRKDVISFISGVLDEPLQIAGRIRVNLFVSSSAPDTAFTAKVIEVFGDGESFNICDGITSLSLRNNAEKKEKYIPGECVEAEIEMWPIFWQIQKGSRIRVDISSSNFPMFNVHFNTDEAWADQSAAIIAEQKIFIGGKTGSKIDFPVEPGIS